MLHGWPGQRLRVEPFAPIGIKLNMLNPGACGRKNLRCVVAFIQRAPGILKMRNAKYLSRRIKGLANHNGLRRMWTRLRFNTCRVGRNILRKGNLIELYALDEQI